MSKIESEVLPWETIKMRINDSLTRPVVHVLDFVYKRTVKYDGLVTLKDICASWLTLLPMCSNVIPRTEKPA